MGLRLQRAVTLLALAFPKRFLRRLDAFSELPKVLGDYNTH